MKIKCVDNALDVLPLTINKIYEVLSERKNTFTILDDKNIRAYYLKERFEIIEEENMKQLTFKEVIANIKEDEIWESLNPKSNIKEISLQDWGISLVTRSDIGAEDVYFGVNNNTKFRLKRKKYSFAEAFKAYEEGKEIESCVTKEIASNFKEFDCFRSDEIRGEWYINS